MTSLTASYDRHAHSLTVAVLGTAWVPPTVADARWPDLYVRRGKGGRAVGCHVPNYQPAKRRSYVRQISDALEVKPVVVEDAMRLVGVPGRPTEPEGPVAAWARLRRNFAGFLRDRAMLIDLPHSIANVGVEEARARGAKSPKVAGKALMLAVTLLLLSLFAGLAACAAWFGLIPNVAT